jgi:hypothetical protein
MFTVSLIVGLILTVTLALLEMEELDFTLTTSSKIKDVSVVTLGALTGALGEPAFVMLADGEDGEVWLHLKLRSLLEIVASVFEPTSRKFVPTRWAEAICATAATGATTAASAVGCDVDEGVADANAEAEGVALATIRSLGLHVFEGAGGCSAREWGKRSILLAIQDCALDQVANVLERKWRWVRARDVELGKDPFTHSHNVLPTLNTILGLLHWSVRCDTILARVGCPGVCNNSSFPFTAIFLLGSGSTDLTIAFLSGAWVDVDCADGDDCASAAREGSRRL